MTQQFSYEKRRCLGAVFGRCKALFFWKRVVFKPWQQAISGRADHIQLGVVDVHVDEAGRDDAAWQVFDRQAWVA